ncbi:MAG: ribonuclease Z [Oscillospiraceae bacterium]|nr:ribonuclease Z [Oscillospiraceae bacterium]
MKLIVCLDNRNGMLFAGRRQSSDRKLRQRILEITAGCRLWMNSYSAKQFGEAGENILVSEGFMADAAAEDCCFAENTDIRPFVDRIDTVILYRWNRDYPADVRFPVELFADRWRLAESCEFAGYSHDTITEEIYML